MKKFICIISIIIFLIVSFFIYKFFINKKDVLLYAKEENFGINSNATNYWKNRIYKVYYDGTMKVYDVYNLTGKKTVKVNRKLTQAEINEIQNELNKVKDEDKNQSLDGTSWEFKEYDESGKVNIYYNGYIYGKKNLENIERILKENCKNIDN